MLRFPVYSFWCFSCSERSLPPQGCKQNREQTAEQTALHWLPLKATIEYKIASLCFQCLCRNTMPPYLSDLLHPYHPSRTLRSLDTSLLTVPRFCLETLGKRSFSVFGPIVRNSLPLSFKKTKNSVRQISLQILVSMSVTISPPCFISSAGMLSIQTYPAYFLRWGWDCGWVWGSSSHIRTLVTSAPVRGGRHGPCWPGGPPSRCRHWCCVHVHAVCLGQG